MSEELLHQARALAPWHMNVALSPDHSTGDANHAGSATPFRARTGDGKYSVSVINPKELRPLLERLYPKGLGGKRFLDCACNAAGYSFLASDLGADYCFGFDVRDHWIEQARFLKRHLGKSDDQVRVEVCDLIDVDERLGSERFDICLFKGIFYHLPDPVAGLKIAADRTNEVLILDTAAASGFEDGFLKVVREGVENPLSGVHHLAWRPTGPAVLARILEWLGFEATCVVFWRKNRPPDADRGRIRIVGARDPALLAGMATPPTTSILIPENGDTLSGTRPLDAGVSDNVIEVSKVEFHLTDGNHDNALIGDATPTLYGWICMWNTTSVANGTYTLNSVAFDTAGKVGRSAGVSITVRN